LFKSKNARLDRDVLKNKHISGNIKEGREGKEGILDHDWEVIYIFYSSP
jgi:hypothetical protein